MTTKEIVTGIGSQTKKVYDYTKETYKNTRFGSKTPRFFRIIRNIGIGCAAVGFAISTAPISLPVGIVALGGYLGWCGGIGAFISQLAKEKE